MPMCVGRGAGGDVAMAGRGKSAAKIMQWRVTHARRTCTHTYVAHIKEGSGGLST